jgi:hypothetical protein
MPGVWNPLRDAPLGLAWERLGCRSGTAEESDPQMVREGHAHQRLSATEATMMTRGIALFAALLIASPALAQTSDPLPPPQAQSRSDTKVPDNKPASTLSDTLSRSGGVITPPEVGDANVKAPPPSGDAPAILPPGTPGANQNVQPK